MKKSFELLLLLPVVLAVVFIVLGFRNGTINRWFAAATPVPTIIVPSQTHLPTIPASVIPYYTSTKTASATPSAAPTFVVLPPATKTPIPTRTNTPLATPTRTAISTNTLAGNMTVTPASQEMLDGIAAGAQVVHAIEDYYLTHGRYPATLTDLVPAYLPGLPVTPANQPYFYRVFDAAEPLAAERYWLAFRVSDQQNLTCTYMRRIEYWDCNYASP